MSDVDKDLIHKTLMQEHERLSADIRLIETQSDKILGFGLTVVGIGLTYGIEKQIVEILVLLPVALLGVYVYAIRRLDQMFWLGGYKRAVEEKVNEIAGRPILHWEALVETKRGRLNHGEIGLGTVYIAAAIASTYISGLKVFEKYGAVALFLLATLIVFFLVLLLLAIKALPRAYSQAYQFGRNKIRCRTPRRRTPSR